MYARRPIRTAGLARVSREYDAREGREGTIQHSEWGTCYQHIFYIYNESILKNHGGPGSLSALYGSQGSNHGKGEMMQHEIN